MRSKLQIAATVFIIGITCFAHGQGTKNTVEQILEKDLRRLSIGEHVPASIFKIIPKKQESELIILDFWSTWCSGCFTAFPKMEQLQQQFDDRLQVVLVNSNETETQVNQRLDKINNLRLKDGQKPVLVPDFPAIHGDGILKKIFPHDGLPLHVWLNGKGKVLAITNGYNATPEHIKMALKGEPLKMQVKDNLDGYSVRNQGWIKPGHSRLPVPAFYSAFMPYYPGAGRLIYTTRDTVTGMIRVTYHNFGIEELYNLAFREDKDIRVLLDVKNKARYKRPTNDNEIDEWNNKNVFSYEISVPLKDEKKIKEYMKGDLNRFFGNLYGIEGKWGKRKVNSLILVKSRDGMLKASDTERTYLQKAGAHIWINNPFQVVVSVLSGYLEDTDQPLAFIDETGYKGNVDIRLTGNLRNLENLRSQLQNYGLDIIQGEREPEVLVISEKNNDPL